MVYTFVKDLASMMDATKAPSGLAANISPII
jgi:hypothetical protein